MGGVYPISKVVLAPWAGPPLKRYDAVYYIEWLSQQARLYDVEGRTDREVLFYLAHKCVCAGIVSAEDVDWLTHEREREFVQRAMDRWNEIHFQSRMRRERWDREHSDRRLNYWLALLPKDIAHQQASWERKQQVRRAYDAGASSKEIARRLKISPQRVVQLYHEGCSRRNSTPPIEKYFKEGRTRTKLIAINYYKSMPHRHARNAYEAFT